MTGFAAIAITLYVAHHVGDYWVQTSHQAQHKGAAGWPGRLACWTHVCTYVMTQAACLALAGLSGAMTTRGYVAALLVSAVTHYMADRREHGLMFWLAHKLGKREFMNFGSGFTTGAWALDQSWHIFWGVFVAAILAVKL